MPKRKNPESEIAGFVEDVAVFYESHGLPRIAGRILGLLLVCEPPERSAGELCEQLGASKGSVSSMVRLLLTAGVIQKTGRPGERTIYYRFRDDGFDSIIDSRMAEYVGFASLAERGLSLMSEMGAKPERTHRLRMQRAMYRFLETEFAEMAKRWRAQRDDLITPRRKR